jgi:hypothetical protein
MSRVNGAMICINPMTTDKIQCELPDQIALSLEKRKRNNHANNNSNALVASHWVTRLSSPIWLTRCAVLIWRYDADVECQIGRVEMHRIKGGGVANQSMACACHHAIMAIGKR